MDASINSITVGVGGGNEPSNTAVGFEALQVNTTLNSGGYENTAVGYLALQVNIDGIGNTAIGWAALDSNNVGVSNTAIGSGAGDNLSGISNYNTFLGSAAGVVSNTIEYSNSTAVGCSATIDASNQIVLGGNNGSGPYPSVYIPGSYVNIGGVYNPSTTYTLDVDGSANFLSLGTDAITAIIDLIYPVNSYYISSSSSPGPAVLFPGTSWTVESVVQPFSWFRTP